ncbi:sigma-70 family RNA polymerase sigma factor [Chitinophaga agri]|uniref:Sigma-70 family RNA polymerase sigma factor n=1 Tax=Chitinophaga agri TaxID=2703787 RepID=A0A6B9ZMK0_9BACT|nr:sigma-70 family RNA polymerase sigma factor [Chitinophaga agri]QHS63468.1 sigma-70 family RNA polymerase sigma factor [Chitinophaga agri]
MLQQLANLPDNELMARARKLKDEEAAGILLERYSHLLAAVSLPSLNSYGNTPDDFFPSLLKRLFKSLQTQTIPKIGEWMQFFVKSQGSRTERNAFYFPTSASSDITRIEYKVEKANIDLLQKQHISAAMQAAFDQLSDDDRDMLTEFYLEQKTFAEIAGERGYTLEETRLLIKQSKQELASQVLANLEHSKPVVTEESTVTAHVKTARPRKETKSAKRTQVINVEDVISDTPEPPQTIVVNVEYNEPVIAEENSVPVNLKTARPRRETRSTKRTQVINVEDVISDAQEPAKPTAFKKPRKTRMAVNVEDIVSDTQVPNAHLAYATAVKEQPTAVLEIVSDGQAEETMPPASVKPSKRRRTIILEIPQTDNQEKAINLDYAKSGKQGQDIKDLQQGSLF